MLRLNEIAKDAEFIAKKRNIPIGTLATLKHCAGEVVEATEAYSVYEENFGTKKAPLKKEDLASELADIIICVLTASAVEEINIEQAVIKAMAQNAERAGVKYVYEES